MKSIVICRIIVFSTWCFQNTITFEKRIKLIQTKAVDLTDIYVLHHSKEFNEVYSNPLKFKDSVLVYLQKPESFQDKLISICSMTKLPLNQYVDFINSCFVIYKKGGINEDLFERSVFNEFDTKSTIIREYRNPQVQHLLNKILKTKRLSKEFKIALIEAINGKAYNDLKKADQLN